VQRRLFLSLSVSVLAASLVSTARAALLPISEDLSVLKLVSDCRLLSQTANRSIDDWIAGKQTNPATLSELSKAIVQAQEFEIQLKRLKLGQASCTLRSAAITSCKELSGFLVGSSALVRSGKPERSSLLRQWRLTLSSSRVCQRQWFQARGEFCESLLRLKLSPDQRAAYHWQSKLNHVWKQQGDYFHQVQELLAVEGETSEKRSQQASSVLRGSLQLHSSLRSYQLDGKLAKSIGKPVSEALRQCQEAALKENILFAKLCEACALFYEDLSPDSISRLKRCFKTLTEASIKLDETILKLVQLVV
jgi:hypothetical protein